MGFVRPRKRVAVASGSAQRRCGAGERKFQGERWGAGGDELCVVLVRAPRGGFRSENGDEQAGAVFENSAEL
jgi:hypothetical protein